MASANGDISTERRRKGPLCPYLPKVGTPRESEAHHGLQGQFYLPGLTFADPWTLIRKIVCQTLKRWGRWGQRLASLVFLPIARWGQVGTGGDRWGHP